MMMMMMVMMMIDSPIDRERKEEKRRKEKSTVADTESTHFRVMSNTTNDPHKTKTHHDDVLHFYFILFLHLIK